MARMSRSVISKARWCWWISGPPGAGRAARRCRNSKGSIANSPPKTWLVLALDVDEPLETVAEYIAKEKFTFPVLLAKGTGVMDRYGVQAYPRLSPSTRTGWLPM